MRINSIIILLLLLSISIFAQKNDYLWQMGNADVFLQPDPTNWSKPFQFNFNLDPMQLEFLPNREWDFQGTSSSYCNDDGELLAYSNGMFIVDSTHQWMEGGELMAYNEYWESNKYKLPGNLGFAFNGFPFQQGNIFLSFPGNKDSVIYIGNKYSFNLGITDTSLYSLIDLSKQDGRGQVVSKDNLLIAKPLKNDGIAATQHANGRDWWVVLESQDNSTYYVFLLDLSGLKLHRTYDGFKEVKGLYPKAYKGTNTFSLQGDKYVSIRGLYWAQKSQLTLIDFDRATGKLSNPKYDTSIKVREASLGISAIFSNDGKYLYANNDVSLYKYDLETDDFPNNRELIAEFDGYESYNNGDPEDPIHTLFGYWQYGPDGKLYNVTSFGRARHMHRMEYPDEEGVECQFTQHAIHTPNNPWTIPNFPNFRLGPIDGSPADTLGLDNNPIAKFRYEQDTIDHLKVRFTDLSYFRPEKWTWNFGDGTTFDGKKPYWHEFPKNGTYNVCLNVSNENSSNTTCRLVTIGTTGIDDIEAEGIGMKEVVSIFPNPVETEMLLTISEYIPEHGIVEVYDMMGRMVKKQRVYYGWNSVDMQSLAVGNYAYIVRDKQTIIAEGRFVKI
jgi:hypothetical protein